MMTKLDVSVGLESRLVFVSAGIPEDDWVDTPFQRHEITQAVIAVVRSVVAANGSLVFGGHPLITPLIFQVAHQIIAAQDDKFERVTLYQSLFFQDVLPASVWDFRNAPWAIVKEVQTSGAPPDAEVSLAEMRRKMLGADRVYDAAVIVGGKRGVVEEYKQFREAFPAMPVYALRRPGGAAANLPSVNVDLDLADELNSSAAYVALSRRIVADIAHRK